MKKDKHLHNVHKTTGTVTIGQSAMLEMFTAFMEVEWLTDKKDAVAWFYGWLTNGDQRGWDDIVTMLKKF